MNMPEHASRWTDLLDEDELGFVKQFLLVSGSLMLTTGCGPSPVGGAYLPGLAIRFKSNAG